MTRSRLRTLIAVSSWAAGAALLLAACGPTTAQSIGTTSSIIVTPGQHKPIDLFGGVPCQPGNTFSVLAFGHQQRVVCIHQDAILTLTLADPPSGDHWGVAGMERSSNGDVVALHSHGEGGGYSFSYRAARPGIDVVHVLMLSPCPRAGCVPDGPPIPEAQWVIRIVRPVDPYPAKMTMQHGLTFSSVGRSLPWGTTLTSAQARWVKLTSSGGPYWWGVWDPNGDPSTYPVRSTDDGAEWTAAGPQLATDWAGGGLFYVSKVFAEGPSDVVMVSNSIIDVTTDSGHQWYQYLSPDDDWTIAADAIGGGVIGIRVSPASYATSLPTASYAIYALDVTDHRWHRIGQSLS